MTPEGERLARAVRHSQALQTARRHLQHALGVLQAAELEATKELAAARDAVHKAEKKTTEQVPA